MALPRLSQHERDLPLSDFAIYVKGGEEDGQHSASLGNVMAITWTRQCADAFKLVCTSNWNWLVSVWQGVGTRLTVLAVPLIECPLAQLQRSVVIGVDLQRRR